MKTHLLESAVVNPVRRWTTVGREIQKSLLAAVAVSAGALCLVACSGCGETAPEEGAQRSGPAQAAAPMREHFGLALEFLKLRDEHNPDQSAIQVVYHLNRWILQQKADDRWMIDRKLFTTLPLAIRNAPATKEMTSDRALAQMQFLPEDVEHIETARWLNATAGFQRDRGTDPEFKAWSQRIGLPAKVAGELAICRRLFDWTIRNIQLDELLPYPKQPEVGPTTGDQQRSAQADWPPPMRGEPGPGYQYNPWQVLLLGHGDELQRARIFMLLARQLHLDAVMLGIETRSGRPRAWLPAVWLENELYLFDPQLGLPIPSADGEGVATLSQVQENPSLLDQLDVGTTFQYEVDADDLSKVVAMIDASPAYLSQRMKILETHLPAEDQMVLSLETPELKKKLTQCEGLNDVRLWAVPYETVMFQTAYHQRVEVEPELQLQEFMERGAFRGLSPLVRARRQQLLGHFDNTDERKGAKTLYMATRTPDTRIEAMEDAKKAEAVMGIRRDPRMSDAQWSQIVKQEKVLRTQGKQHASYFLALSHMDNGDYSIAANWLQKRTLDASPDGPWTNGARYNLARCFEQLGDYEKAEQLYLIDESPQRHGNLIRARRLEEKTGDDKS